MTLIHFIKTDIMGKKTYGTSITHVDLAWKVP